MNEPFREDSRKEILNRISFGFSSAHLIVIEFKVLQRLHFTKSRLSQLVVSTDDTCDRRTLSPANYANMFFFLH